MTIYRSDYVGIRTKEKKRVGWGIECRGRQSGASDVESFLESTNVYTLAPFCSSDDLLLYFLMVIKAIRFYFFIFFNYLNSKIDKLLNRW